MWYMCTCQFTSLLIPVQKNYWRKTDRKDSYAKFKYDATKEQDGVITGRVQELAEKRGVSMTEISLAWPLT